MKIEQQLLRTLNTIFTGLIKEKGLEGKIQSCPVQEEDRTYITIKNSGGKTIFFIELKDPISKAGKSVFKNRVLVHNVERAQHINVKYFGICNFLACAFFDRNNLYDNVSVNEGYIPLTDIEQLSKSYLPRKAILNKLRIIAGFYIELALEIINCKTVKFTEPDQLFIFKIRKLIEVFAHPISSKVWEKYKCDKAFKNEIQIYTQSQLWNKPATVKEIENLTHISILTLISKLIFCKTYVDNQIYNDLRPMQVSDNVNTSTQLEKLVWKYLETFKEVTGNFELLLGDQHDIIFKIPFLSDAIIDLVKEVIDTSEQYDFSKIPFDIIGRIFEELIRKDERHALGQYFTPPNVIDLINAFAIHNSDDMVFDPSCGSGTFLVRAYERKRLLKIEEGKKPGHEDLLSEIYGNDFSGYTVYLSTLNLAIRSTRVPGYPRISNKDFFAITEDSKIDFYNSNGKKVNTQLPKFDAIIGNPPFTRQEDIGTMHGTVDKTKIQTLIKSECGFNPSQRTSIYSYFFYHAGVFLKNHGYLAFVCQNSWLDTSYGIEMQRYLLSNYEIAAIMDSESERFFPSASVNTTIVILRKQDDEQARSKNIVKFVYFSSTLADTINNYKGVKKLYNYIQMSNKSVSNKHLHINCIPQQKLSKCIKWGKFLKAPQVYFDIMERGADKFMPLKQLADVKFGIKTGADKFFIVKDMTGALNDNMFNAIMNQKHFNNKEQLDANNLKVILNGYKELWLIEKDFVIPCLASSKDTNQYDLSRNKFPNSVLLINYELAKLKLKFPFAYEYIMHGISKGINEIPSCASRNTWYIFYTKKAPGISFNSIINDFGRSYLGKVYPKADGLKSIYVKEDENKKNIWYYLNSTLCWMEQQFMMRNNFGEGAGDIKVYELEEMPVIIDSKIKNLQVDPGEIQNYKKEFGSLESLKTVNPARIKLDSAILGVIGYKNKKERDTVLLELYRALCKIIDARMQKAQGLRGVRVKY